MNEIKCHILLVEDNQQLAEQLCDFLQEKGMVVDYAADGRTALALLKNQHFDVVILDLTLPDMDGLTICNFIKAELATNIPVLMLTARDSIEEKLAGFSHGTDDYLTKPYVMDEVYVRCLALARRHQLHKSQQTSIGDLQIDFNQKTVHRCGQMITLSKTDFLLLQLLVEAYPNALSKRQLIEKVWGDDMPDTDAVRSHIYTLRNAIDKPFSYPLIKTVHGLGFKIVIPD
jgi:DNA-binding response OmpR family regulator